MSWAVERRRGTAAAHHARELPPERAVWVFEVDQPTLVLGSAQPADVLDQDRVAASGLAVARRRSGGGVVGLTPGGSLWVDVVIPASDEHWDLDVARSFSWIGGVWGAALRSLGAEPTLVRAPDRTRPWSALVCFAGHSTGEILLEGAKVVGLSQRRTRGWARYQCLVQLDTDLTLVTSHLRLDDDRRATMIADLASAVAAAPASADRVLRAFLDQLG